MLKGAEQEEHREGCQSRACRRQESLPRARAESEGRGNDCACARIGALSAGNARAFPAQRRERAHALQHRAGNAHAQCCTAWRVSGDGEQLPAAASDGSCNEL
jgi:hypothetical protein